MTYANQNEKMMARCLALAEKGRYYVAPNPMVGALLVSSDGKIVAEGWHRQFGGPHAEVNCFREAEECGFTDYAHATLYVSLEPCSHYGKTPPCARLIVEKGVGKVVIGMLDPNPQVSGRGVELLRQAGIEVEIGVLEEACRLLNCRFLMLHEHHRPYIVLKWAQTQDGFIDYIMREEGKPLVISSPVTKQIVHKMRAENMAILVGTRTALKDNPSLRTTRWNGRNPIRVLLDREGIVPADSKMLQPDEPQTPAYPGEGVIVYRERTDWPYVVDDLARRGIHSVLVEGGATVLNRILESGLYDEVHVEVAPISIGSGVAAPRVQLPSQPEYVTDGHALFVWKRL